VAEKKVKSDLPVRDFKLTPKFGDLTFLRATASVALEAAGLTTLAQQLGVAGALEPFSLDGMLALWRPAASN
jgi:protease-4